MSNALNHHRYACVCSPTASVGGSVRFNLVQMKQHSRRTQPVLAVRMAKLSEKSEKGDSLHGLWLFKQLQPHQRFTDVAAGHRVSIRLGQRPAARITLRKNCR